MTNPTVWVTGSPEALNDSVYVPLGYPVVFTFNWYIGPASLVDMNVKFPLGALPGAALGEMPVTVIVICDDDRFVRLEFVNCTLIGTVLPLFEGVVWL